jgi:hypothetical protein
MFSVRFVSQLTSPNFKASGSRFLPLNDLNDVAQEPWRGHAYNGLGRNKWHYSSFVSIHLSARCIISGPRTTPSTPTNEVIASKFNTNALVYYSKRPLDYQT